jgi:hypothetical protein
MHKPHTTTGRLWKLGPCIPPTMPHRAYRKRQPIENRTLPARPASAFLTTPGHRVRDTCLHTCTPAHDSDALRC